MPETPFTVGFSGKPGSAKNLYSFKLMQELRFQGYSVAKTSLAASLYEDVNTIIDALQAGREVDWQALTISAQWVPEVEALGSGEVGERNLEWGYSRRNANVRKLLALLGGTIRQRQEGGLYLFNRMLAAAPAKDFLLYSDLRYPAEAQATRERGAAVRCEVNQHWVEATSAGKAADGYKYSAAGMADPTETALDGWDGWFCRLTYGFNRPILFSRSLLRTYGFAVPNEELFTVHSQ